MDEKKLVDKLIVLSQLEIHTIFAYDEAADCIEDDAIRQVFAAFRGDHDGHLADLTMLIRGLGGISPKKHRDFRGFFFAGMVPSNGEPGTRGALMALLATE